MAESFTEFVILIQDKRQRSLFEAARDASRFTVPPEEEIKKELRERETMNSLGFFLQRYAAKKAGRKVPALPSDVETPPEQCEDELFSLICDSCGVDTGYKAKKMGLKTFIQKKDLGDYARNEKLPNRSTLFSLSIMLGFDEWEMGDMMKAAGESPTYNWHDAYELIAYFCHRHRIPDMPREYDALCRFYDELPFDEESISVENVTTSKMLSAAFNQATQIQDLASSKAEFKEFLRTYRSSFGFGPLRARDSFFKELGSIRLTGEMAGFIKPDFAVPEDKLPTKVILLDVFNKSGKKSGVPDLDSHHIQKGRISGLRSGDLHVDKWDLLQVIFSKVCYLTDFRKLTAADNKTRQDFINGFISYADYQLKGAGLPPVYQPAPRDYMLLAALCTRDPIRFLNGFFDIDTDFIPHKSKADDPELNLMARLKEYKKKHQ